MATEAEKVQKYEEILKLLANSSIAGYLRTLKRNEQVDPTLDVTLTACDITAFAKLDNALAANGIKLQSAE